MPNVSTLRDEVLGQLSPETKRALQRRRERAVIDWRKVLDDLPLYMQAELRRLRRQYRIPYERLVRLEVGQ